MTRPVIDRRTLLESVSATVATTILSRSAFGQTQTPSKRIKLAPIDISESRIVKTIVGLRPFRPQGYVVRTEKLGEKIVVHNYGHGGAGVTISWGTADLAVKQILAAGQHDIAVLGCGAVGLATARLLQQAGLKPTIYARDLPPNTTSDVAGARWYPFDLFDRAVATPAFLTELWRISHFSYDIFAKLGPEYGIRRYMTYACRNTPFPKESLLHMDSPVHDLLPRMRDLSAEENPTPFPLVRTFETLFIEPNIYLPKLIGDFKRAGGQIVVRDFPNTAALQALKESTIVNCTGIGAAMLFGDRELTPIKGQLIILPPQPDIDYITLPPGGYMFPRSDGIILGGTFQRGVWTLEPDRVEEKRVLDDHARFYRSLKR